jgi:hypothetical protein
VPQVRIVHPQSLVASAFNQIIDQNAESGDENVCTSQQEPVASTSSSSSNPQPKQRKTSHVQPEKSGDRVPVSVEMRSSTSSSPSSSQIISQESATTVSLLPDLSPERLFPSFVDTPIPRTVTPLSEVVRLPYERPSYAMEAAATDCNFKHNDVCSLVHVHCRKCGYIDTLADRMGGKMTDFVRKANRTKQLDVISCPDKSHANHSDADVPSLDFAFNLFFAIRDKQEKDSEMIVSLSTLSAIKLFGVTPMDALRFEEKRAKVFQILEEICPSDESHRPDNFLMWLVKAVPVGSIDSRFIVLTITKGCSGTNSASAK